MGAAASTGDSSVRHAVPPGGVIRILEGFYEGLEVPIDRDWLVIGRGRTADLVIAEPTISRTHAAVGYDGKSFFAEDLGSTNGMLVNGKKQKRQAVSDGDKIQIGKLQIQVSLPS